MELTKKFFSVVRSLNRSYHSGPHYKHQKRRQAMYWDKVEYHAKKEKHNVR